MKDMYLTYLVVRNIAMSSEANTAVIISVCTVTVLLRIKSSSMGPSHGHRDGSRVGRDRQWGTARPLRRRVFIDMAKPQPSGW